MPFGKCMWNCLWSCSCRVRALWTLRVQSTCMTTTAPIKWHREEKKTDRVTNKQINECVHIMWNYAFIYAVCLWPNVRDVYCTQCVVVAATAAVALPKCNKLISFKRDFKWLYWSNDSLKTASTRTIRGSLVQMTRSSPRQMSMKSWQWQRHFSDMNHVK